MDCIKDLEIVLILNYIRYDYINGTFWVYSDKYPGRRLSMKYIPPLEDREGNWSVLDADDNGPLHFPHVIMHPIAKSMVVKFNNGEMYW